MKIWIPLILFTLGFSHSCKTPAAQTTTKNDMKWILEDLAKKWKGTKSYTIAILEAMPEADYSFKATEEVMTFQGQAEHIHKWMDNHMKRLGHEGLAKLDVSNKKNIIISLGKNFDTIIHFFERSNPKMIEENIDMWYGKSSKLRLIHLMDNHIAHHRGQMIMYLRLKGIKPPRYIGW